MGVLQAAYHIGNYWIGVVALVASVIALWVALVIVRWMDAGATTDIRATHQRILAAATATACVIAVFGAADVYVHVPPHEARADVIGLAFVSSFSGLVGFSEIAQRYRDRPLRLLTVTPALIYIYINMAAGVGAFALVAEFQVFKGAHAALYSVMLASFGAVAFFRSSLFTARIGDADVDVGPATLLKGLLSMTDQLINRWQAGDRAEAIAQTMRTIDFDKAKDGLSILCLTSVEYITQEQQASFGNAVKKLSTDVEDRVQRSILLGVYLTQLVGPEVLTRAVSAMGDSIKATPPRPRTPPASTSLA
jgi:hypothetical protein